MGALVVCAAHQSLVFPAESPFLADFCLARMAVIVTDKAHGPLQLHAPPVMMLVTCESASS